MHIRRGGTARRLFAAIMAALMMAATMCTAAGCAGEQSVAPAPASATPTASASPGANAGSEAPATPSPKTSTAAANIVSPLHVQGAKLLDEHDRPKQLRGVSTHGIAWFPQYVNADLFANLKRDWKINTVRIAMYTAENGGYTTGGDQANLKTLVRTGVDAAIVNGMYVIVDWHTLSDNDPLTHVDEAKRFFSEISRDYAGKPNVLYEICNEPNNGTPWSDVKQYAKQVIPVIRANDPDAVVLVGTPNWCQDIQDAQNDPIDGFGNVMYTMHFYAASHKNDLRNRMVAAVQAGVPVFVSEFGLVEASGEGEPDYASAQAWLGTMDEYDISYVIWNMSNKQEGAALFTTGETRNPQDGDLSPAAKWYRDYLREHMREENS